MLAGQHCLERDVIMGVILPFKPREPQRTVALSRATTEVSMVDAEQTLHAAMDDGSDSSATLAVAQPLLDLCSNLYGFTVMQDGLPSRPEELARVLRTLARTLRQLEVDIDGPRPVWNFGVYFGQQELAWFEDGYGSMSGLAVPNEIDADELEEFIQPRIKAF